MNLRESGYAKTAPSAAMTAFFLQPGDCLSLQQETLVVAQKSPVWRYIKRCNTGNDNVIVTVKEYICCWGFHLTDDISDTSDSGGLNACSEAILTKAACDTRCTRAVSKTRYLGTRKLAELSFRMSMRYEHFPANVF